jgi:hypothetical protein
MTRGTAGNEVSRARVFSRPALTHVGPRPRQDGRPTGPLSRRDRAQLRPRQEGFEPRWTERPTTVSETVRSGLEAGPLLRAPQSERVDGSASHARKGRGAVVWSRARQTLAPDETGTRMDRSCLLPMRCATRRARLWPLARLGVRSAWPTCDHPAPNRAVAGSKPPRRAKWSRAGVQTGTKSCTRLAMHRRYGFRALQGNRDRGDRI